MILVRPTNEDRNRHLKIKIRGKNHNWLKEKKMVIYKRDRGVELATTEKKDSAEGIELGAYNRSAASPPRSNFRAIWGKTSFGAPVS